MSKTSHRRKDCVEKDRVEKDESGKTTGGSSSQRFCPDDGVVSPAAGLLVNASSPRAQSRGNEK
jgi:hypothetical protein